MTQPTHVILTMADLAKVISPKVTNMLNWCDEHGLEKPQFASISPNKNGFRVIFKREEDAVLFTLKWK